MHPNTPISLRSTYHMLANTFSSGVPEEHYFILLKILYEELSARNLALVISEVTKKEYSEVINNIYRLPTIEYKENVRKQTLDRLKIYGYDNWLKEQ